MTLKQNIIANYAGTAITTAAPMLALPWYLSLLGPEQFGLISLAITLQTLLGLLDAGISQALVREFAIRLENGKQGLKQCALLLGGFEKIYWLFTLALGGIILLSANWLEEYWFHSDNSDHINTLAIYGSVAMFMAQFPGAIYRSLFNGSLHHITLNKILATSIFFRHLGCILLLSIWSSPLIFFGWHTLVILVETIIRFKFAWHILLPEKFTFTWDVNEVRKVWVSTLQLSLSVILGSLVIQFDKIILSHLVSVTDFGYYIIAATIATGLLQVIYPLIQTVLPIAARLVDTPAKLKKLYSNLLFSITIAIISVGIIFMGYGQKLLIYWLGSEASAHKVYLLLQILLIGTGLNALYNIGYINWLIKKKTKKILQTNLLSLFATLICTPILINTYGVSGAAFGWILISIIGFLLSIEWIYH